MATSYPSRDAIAMKIFGRKFSLLDLSSKQYIVKTYDVLRNTQSQGVPQEFTLNTLAKNEVVNIVKQLKQITVNPGDVIELPKGVIEDAARAVHYQSQAVGRGRVLDPKDLAQIKKEIKSRFGDLDPRIITCVTDYLTNATGRFSGVGPRTLRNKLRSFLTSDEMRTISNKEIVATRDIVIAHLFDKWSGGNLTSFVTPRIETLLSTELRKLSKSVPKQHTSKGATAQDVQEVIEALESLEQYQNNPNRLANPIVQKAMRNLGINPGDVIGKQSKEILGDITSAAHQQAGILAKRQPVSKGGGLRTRRNFSILPGASTEYTESLPKRKVLSGIGGKTRVGSRWFKQRYSKGFAYDVPSRWDIQNSEDESIKLDLSDYGRSETFDFSNPTAEMEYGINRVLKPRRNSGELDIDVGPRGITEYYTDLLTKYSGSVTRAESLMGISRMEKQIHLEDIGVLRENQEMYKSRYGDALGRFLHENDIPLDIADKIVLARTSKERWERAKESAKWFNSSLTRQEGPLSVKADEISLFKPAKILAGMYGLIPTNSSLYQSVSKFKSIYAGRGRPTQLPGVVQGLVKSVVAGTTAIPGVRRVGVVGSKSWDNPKAMRKWFGKNWDPANVMVVSAEVGKGLDNSNFGAAYQASNWAFQEGALQYKVPTRKEYGIKKSGVKYLKNDWTTADVIHNSDEVVAFFDEAYLSPSGVAQFNRITESIGDKPLRIVWVPTNFEKSPNSMPFGMHMMEFMKSHSNVVFDKYSMGTLPQSMSGMKFKMLARGGALKSNETAIVGEAGPELLIPSGAGGFHVIPNHNLRMLEKGTFTPRKNVIVATNDTTQPDAHFYKTQDGRVLPSVSTVLSNYSDEAAAKAASMKNIPEWVSQVGNYAHAKAEFYAQGNELNMDAFQGPDLSPYVTRTQSLEKLYAMGERAGDALIAALDQMGFIAYSVEERFVDLTKGFSGTVDLLGSIAGTPAVIDLKAQGNSTFGKEDPRYKMQVGAYASMFEETPDMLKVLSGNRETGESYEYTYVGDQITEAIQLWENALASFNDRLAKGLVRIPELISNGVSGRSAVPANLSSMYPDNPAWARWFTLGTTHMSIPTPEGEQDTTMLTLDPQHLSQAVGKYLPKYGSAEWDKSPARLKFYESRFNELYNSAANDPDSVSPAVRKIIDTFSNMGIDHDQLVTLLRAPKGSIPDNPDYIKALKGQYDIAKARVFAEKAPDESDVSRYLDWEDFRTIANVLEEAGKAFASVPQFSKSSPKSSPTPGQNGPIRSPNEIQWPWEPSDTPDFVTIMNERKNARNAHSPDNVEWAWNHGPSYTPESAPKARCKGVDLCKPTMDAFRNMFKGFGSGSSTGGGGGSRGSSRGSKPDDKRIPNIPTGGIMNQLMKLPLIGHPLEMRKGMYDAQEKLEAFDSRTQTYEEYLKLQQKHQIATQKYYRSIRGVTTSLLIADHVLRIFGRDSQIINKSLGAFGQGLGYMMDMFLLPVMPLLRPLLGGLIGIGNVFKSMNHFLGGFAAPIVLLGLGVITKRFIDLIKTVTSAPAAIDRLVAAIDRLTQDRVMSHIPGDGEGYRGAGPYPEPKAQQQYTTPIGPARPSLFTKAKRMFGYATGGKVADTGLAYLHAGEMVIPSDIVRRHGFAEGGLANVTGGLASPTSTFSNIMGTVMGGYGSLMSSDIVQGLVGGLGVVSKSIGAMMAPLAPAMAVGAVGGKGFNMIRNAVNRNTQVVSGTSESGFGSLRTIGSAQLVSLITGLGPLLPIAAAAAGIYAWSQGYGAMAEGILSGIRSLLDSGKTILKGLFDWLKERFKIETPEAERGKDTKKTDDQKRSEEKKVDEERKRTEEKRAEDKKVEDKKRAEDQRKAEEERKAREETGRRSPWELVSEKYKGLIDRFPILKGVPGMGILGGVIGAMESNNPIEIAKSAVLGAAGQAGFNVLGGKSPAAAGILGGFLAPEFAGSVANAIVNGKGALSPSNWPLIGQYIKGNETLETGLRVGGSVGLSAPLGAKGMAAAALSDAVGGVGGIFQTILGGGPQGIIGEYMKSSEITNRPIEGKYGLFGEVSKLSYNALQGAEIARLNAGGVSSEGDALGRILGALETLIGLNKQPTINQNTFEIKYEDDYRMAQAIDDALTRRSNQVGVQRSIG